MNIRRDVLSNMTKAELVDFVEMTGALIEQVIATKYGLQHNTEVNGVDAFCPKTKQAYEIKSQVYSGKYALRGRGKYGFISDLIAAKKLAIDEQTIIVGVCGQTAEVLYEYLVPFAAVHGKYMDSVARSHNKNWSNCDIYPRHYTYHPDFKVLSVVTPKVLLQNQHKFQQKFFKIIMAQSKAFHNTPAKRKSKQLAFA
jgi:hypothetical protein